MLIDGGSNDGYAAWSDAGGLAMGHYDYSHSALFALARQYVLADRFFQGAFGGSFLNHQYLICACAPEYPNADTSPAKPTVTVLETGADGHMTPRLKIAKGSPASALDGPIATIRASETDFRSLIMRARRMSTSRRRRTSFMALPPCFIRKPRTGRPMPL